MIIPLSASSKLQEYIIFDDSPSSFTNLEVLRLPWWAVSFFCIPVHVSLCHVEEDKKRIANFTLNGSHHYLPLQSGDLGDWSRPPAKICQAIEKPLG
jgi:hypothetical protein